LVRDSITHNPVAAKVFINGYDKDSSQVYSDTLTGSFVRFLSPGLWNLTFSAKGYWPVTISNINVTDRQKTDLIVDISPYANKVETPISEGSLLIYPSPAHDEIRAMPPDGLAGKVNIRIINSAGMLVSDYISDVVHGIPLIIDIKKLSSGTFIIVIASTITKTSYRGRFVVIK
jgi:hypothetical protein